MERKIGLIEKRIASKVKSFNFQMRVSLILAELLQREELAHNLNPSHSSIEKLSERVQKVRQEILQHLEERYPDANAQGSTEAEGSAQPQRSSALMDRVWQLSSYVRYLLRQKFPFAPEVRKQFLDDLRTLKRLSDLGGWQSDYLDMSPTQERLAESIMKLERDVCGVRRPRPLAKREVRVRIGKPINLANYLVCYRESPHKARHNLAEQLRQEIQALLDSDKGIGYSKCI